MFQFAAIACEQQTESERQHATHKVVTHTVKRLTFRVAEHLHEPTHNHKDRQRLPPSTEEQQTIDDVELKHQSEEPEGTWPYHMVRVGHDVVEHAKLCNDSERRVVPAARRYGIDHGESDKTYHHHLKQFEVMITQEGEG